MRQKEIFISGNYSAEIDISGKRYSVKLSFGNGIVIHESLVVDGVERMSRNADGIGWIFYEKENTNLAFQVLPNAIALQQRQDPLQHPFLTDLSKWANGAHAYFFNRSFSNSALVTWSTMQAAEPTPDFAGDGADVIKSYTRAYEKFGIALDEAVINDMRILGYNLNSIHCDDMRTHMSIKGAFEPILGLVVVESDVGIPIPQLQMSQGMFRALCLVIQMNIASLGNERSIVLIDDIGEGLDFERSVALIDIIMRHAHSANVQIFMTTNDRFVMNQVPLTHWIILQRKNSILFSYTERSHPTEFEDFKFMGLSNFDFFTSATFH